MSNEPSNDLRISRASPEQLLLLRQLASIRPAALEAAYAYMLDAMATELHDELHDEQPNSSLKD